MRDHATVPVHHLAAGREHLVSAAIASRLTDESIMRIAISGSHATGKSTLVEQLTAALPGIGVEDEAYYALLADGSGFADVPEASDYERLCERACEQLEASAGRRILHDRTPADYLAYLTALGAELENPSLYTRAQQLVVELDLVVFVPIESPDPIRGAERRRLRRAVDRTLRDVWIDDAWGWDVPVLVVSGPPEARARQVLARIGRA